MRHGFSRREMILVGIIVSLLIAWWVDHLMLISPRDQFRKDSAALRVELRDMGEQFADAGRENTDLRAQYDEALKQLTDANDEMRKLRTDFIQMQREVDSGE